MRFSQSTSKSSDRGIGSSLPTQRSFAAKSHPAFHPERTAGVRLLNGCSAWVYFTLPDGESSLSEERATALTHSPRFASFFLGSVFEVGWGDVGGS